MDPAWVAVLGTAVGAAGATAAAAISGMLAAIWRSLNERDPDLATVTARLDSARELITGAKRASATNFVEGPELTPCCR